MMPDQTLSQITSNILSGIDSVIKSNKYDLCLVHGDTSTTFATALACFYNNLDVGHVEAGLRTWNMKSPYPEEFNRQAVSLFARWHFAPTERAKDNLIRESHDPKTIFVTGNTAIDTLKTTIMENWHNPILDWVANRKLLLITAHRRENYGEPMKNMFIAIRRVLNEHKDICAVYPVHLSPIVRNMSNEIFGDCDQISLIDPMSVLDFHNLMKKLYHTTDSGGIQEEAPSLGIPVLVMRDTTERPEGIEAGTIKLVGTTEGMIYHTLNRLLNSNDAYRLMSTANNPYGDGHASERIVSILENDLIT